MAKKPKKLRIGLAALEQRPTIQAGVDRVALPITAFLPDLEASLAAFGEEVIAKSGG